MESVAELIDASDGSLVGKIKTVLQWDVADPFAVQLNFHESTETVAWRIDHEMLRDTVQGTEGIVRGIGDIQLLKQSTVLDIRLFSHEPPDPDEHVPHSVVTRFPLDQLQCFTLLLGIALKQHAEQIAQNLDREINALLQGA
jgi:hypothetical protein